MDWSNQLEKTICFSSSKGYLKILFHNKVVVGKTKRQLFRNNTRIYLNLGRIHESGSSGTAKSNRGLCVFFPHLVPVACFPTLTLV